MQAYELLVASLLEREGFWVRQSFKVALTPEDKRTIGRPSSPRWEIDLLAYRPGDNQLRVVECKSYFDSRGVNAADIVDGDASDTRYKLFVDPVLRQVVVDRLRVQLQTERAIPPDVDMRLCLAAGRVASAKDRERLYTHFQAQHWLLLDEKWAQDGLQRMAAGGYDNSIAAVAAKLLCPLLPVER